MNASTTSKTSKTSTMHLLTATEIATNLVEVCTTHIAVRATVDVYSTVALHTWPEYVRQTHFRRLDRIVGILDRIGWELHIIAPQITNSRGFIHLDDDYAAVVLNARYNLIADLMARLTFEAEELISHTGTAHQGPPCENTYEGNIGMVHENVVVRPFEDAWTYSPKEIDKHRTDLREWIGSQAKSVPEPTRNYGKFATRVSNAPTCSRCLTPHPNGLPEYDLDCEAAKLCDKCADQLNADLYW